MTEQVTTKPGKKYASIKNPRVYEALRREGMSKTRAARISNAQMHKDAGTMPGAMLSGPGGLLATPGMGGRKWGNRRKDSGCTCGVNVATKEQLAPGVTRIRGNLCNVHGRYGPCDASQSGKRKPKAPKGRKPKKPVLTPEQRAQERQAQREANRAKVLTALGIDADGQAALTALRNGEQPNAAALAKMGAIDAGLVEQAADGSYRLTASGRAMLSAADQGDQGRAGDTISGARDRLGARRTRQEAAAQRKRDAEAKRAAAEAKKKQPKGGSSGGKSPGSARGSTGENADRASERAQRQREHEEDRARRLREHEEDRSRRQRERDEDRAARLAERRQRSQPTSPGTTVERVPTHTTRVDMPKRKPGPRKRQTTKAETYGGVKRSNLDDSVFAGPDRSFPIKTAQDVRDAVRSLGRTKHDKAAVKRGIIRRARAIGATDALPDDWRATTKALRVVPTGGDTIQGNATAPEAYLHAHTYGEVSQSWLDQLVRQGYAYSTDNGYALYEPGELVAKRPELQAKLDHIRASNRPDLKSFAVFKDDTDAWRWVARTTTAYRDRDGEIITTKALELDAQRMTQTKQYGPLRYWHIGNPDPFDPLAPWGNGLDIGDCDYSIVIGRTSIESGTFKSHAIGKAFAEHADEYEMSPGFFHPPNQPNTAGEYDNIRRFERSVVPVKYGRASNLFTGMTVKEHRMDNQTYKARVEAFLADMNSKGVPEQVAATALAGMERADKSAQAQGIAYKSDDAPLVFTAPDGTQGIISDGHFVALKAMAPASMEEAGETEIDDALEEQADEGDPEADDMGGEYIGDMTPAEFWAQLQQYLAPVLKMQDMVKAMGDMHGEMKNMMGGYATKEAGAAAEIAALKAEQEKLATRLAELTGDQPAVTVPADVEAALKSDGPKAPPTHPAVPQFDPSRPFQGWAAQTWPQLYDANTQQNRS